MTHHCVKGLGIFICENKDQFFLLFLLPCTSCSFDNLRPNLLHCLQQEGKLPGRTKKPLKHYHETGEGGRTSAVRLRKGINIPYGSVPPQGSKSNKRRLASLDLKPKVIRLGDGGQVGGRLTDSLNCLLSKLSYSRSALPINSHTSPPPATNKRRQ